MYNTLIKRMRYGKQHLQKIQKIQSYQAKGQIGYISPTERFF